MRREDENAHGWVIEVQQGDGESEWIGWRCGCRDEPGIALDSAVETALKFADRASAERMCEDIPDDWDVHIRRFPILDLRGKADDFLAELQDADRTGVVGLWPETESDESDSVVHATGRPALLAELCCNLLLGLYEKLEPYQQRNLRDALGGFVEKMDDLAEKAE